MGHQKAQPVRPRRQSHPAPCLSGLCGDRVVLGKCLLIPVLGPGVNIPVRMDIGRPRYLPRIIHDGQLAQDKRLAFDHLIPRRQRRLPLADDHPGDGAGIAGDQLTRFIFSLWNRIKHLVLLYLYQKPGP